MQLHSHQVSFSSLGGMKSGHPGRLVVTGVRGVGVEGVDVEGVEDVGEGVDGQDQLKNWSLQSREQFT